MSNQTRYTNVKNLPMSLAVWLMKDSYDYNYDPNYLSVTTLMRPVRQIILNERIKPPVDISDLITSRSGSAIHDSLEKAWTDKNLPNVLSAIGFPMEIAERIKVNPEKVNKGDIPVYLEKRGFYKYGKYTIGGKFDICIDGTLEDFKNTGTFTYSHGTREDEFIKQGSYYRLIFPEIITGNVIKINYIFKDFMPSRINTANYPPAQAIQESYPLMSIEATKRMLEKAVDDYDQYRNADEADLPLCPPEELWLSPKVFAYYKSASNKSATKLYDNEKEAKLRVATDGGVIQYRGGEPKRCDYCNGKFGCSQYNRMMENLEYERSNQAK